LPGGGRWSCSGTAAECTERGSASPSSPPSRASPSLFPRNDGLALFDLLGSPDKTLHANPGGHLGIPRAEFGDAVRFLARCLGSGSSGDGGDSTGPLRPPGAFDRRGAMG
jgi:hypothetical protein